MSWKRLFVILVLLIFFRTPVYHNPSQYQCTNISYFSKLTQLEPSLLDFTEPNAWNLLVLKNGNWQKNPLLLPYIAYSPKELVANYGDFGNNVTLFFQGNSLPSLEQRSLFPRIAFPFLFMTSSDRTYTEIYKVSSSGFELLAHLDTPNIITSYNASPSGQYAIITTLSNELIVLDSTVEHNNIVSIHLNFPHSVTYAAHITDSGTYYVLGSYKPSLLLSGNISEPENQESIEIPNNLEAKTQNLLAQKNFLFVHSIYGFTTINIKNEQDPTIENFALQRPYPLKDTFQLQKNDIAFLYEINRDEYLLDIIDIEKQKLVYKTQFSTSSIPKFLKQNHQHYLLYKEGVILL